MPSTQREGERSTRLVCAKALPKERKEGHTKMISNVHIGPNNGLGMTVSMSPITAAGNGPAMNATKTHNQHSAFRSHTIQYYVTQHTRTVWACALFTCTDAFRYGRMHSWSNCCVLWVDGWVWHIDKPPSSFTRSIASTHTNHNCCAVWHVS